MVTVAFLQCLWAKDPARVKRMLAEDHPDMPNWREDLLARLLFMGGLTGRRLWAAFGEEACNEIIWEEITTEIGGESRAIFPADQRHITQALKKHSPGMILCFGVLAAKALDENFHARTTIPVPVRINGPHPAARDPFTAPLLMAMRREWEAERQKPLDRELTRQASTGH